MARNRRHAFSNAELYQGIGKYFDTKDISSIQRRFSRGEIDAKTAIKQFERTSSLGTLRAGEIAVEEALKTSKPKLAVSLFNQAEDLFIRTDQMQQLHWPNRLDSIRARAQIDLAYLPVHKLVYVNELPPLNVAEAVYQQTVLTGNSLAKEYRDKNPDVSKSDRHDINGTCAEIGALALLQRLPIVSGLDPQTWFPRFTYYSEVHRNTHGAILSRSADLVVMSKRGPEIETDYLLQVRASDFRKAEFKPNEPGITTVCVNPELRLDTDRFNVGCLIVEECFKEMTQPRRRSYFAGNLNQRTDKLQDLLDAEANAPDPAIMLVPNPESIDTSDFEFTEK
ncbi:MAG: hypothetical protein ABSB12_02745 [Candidatus Saccharimonadales bacterium]